MYQELRAAARRRSRRRPPRAATEPMTLLRRVGCGGRGALVAARGRRRCWLLQLWYLGWIAYWNAWVNPRRDGVHGARTRAHPAEAARRRELRHQWVAVRAHLART
ncbi:MAG: hypothetical protein MZW92_34225 [Comamonadaceae bacterium]|nr:hypothetical protein [Comamonadaceae bacterium]